ncbi:MAG: large conductance mechanosensitive channel protein MscL [Gemmataceae bacterium]|nr:large conductance mechanosensitive channel protein MscL [Gemmataceae bacterium]
MLSLAPTKKAASFAEEFKAFAFKGTVIDLAIGIVIGGAFGKIVDSLVKNILMPLFSALFPGEKGYLGWMFTFNGINIPFGLFLGELVNFVIVALAMFLFIVKFLDWLVKFRHELSPLSRDQELLTEIRDLLRAKRDEGKASE